MQRHYSANKGLYSQGYSLPSGHILLWELDHKEGRMPKNWCLRTVVLEKTPESPLVSKEIKPVNLKGDQPWIFTRRTDVEAEAPGFWSSDALFSFGPQSFSASGTFPMSQLFISHDQNTGASASASVLPMNEYSGLISLKIDWFDFLAVQETFRSLLQHHSLKTSILWHSAFFMVQVSHPYVTAGKTIALTVWTFVSRVMSLLFNTLSRFVTAFLPRNNLIVWLQSPSAVILEPKKRKSITAFTLSPLFAMKQWGQMPWS